MNTNRLPDHEARMDEVRQLADEVRQQGHTPALKIEPNELQSKPGLQSNNANAPRGLFAPVTLAPAHEGVPTSYILHIHTHMCSNCGCGEEYSEFFARYTMRTRTGSGTPVTHLRRCDKPMYNIPVERRPVGVTRIPFCSECTDFNLSHLPSPPDESYLSPQLPPDLTRKGAKPKAPATKKQPTLEDLL